MLSGLRGTVTFSAPVAPLFAIDDPKVTAMGNYPNGQVALGKKTVGGQTTYYSAVGNLPSTLLRSIAKESGVPLFVDGDSPVYINSRLLGIHQQADEVTVTLPHDVTLTELFQGNTVQTKEKTLVLGAETRGRLHFYLCSEPLRHC